jgi:hypothetical protein
MNVTGSGSCHMAGLGISRVETLVFAISMSVSQSVSQTVDTVHLIILFFCFFPCRGYKTCTISVSSINIFSIPQTKTGAGFW